MEVTTLSTLIHNFHQSTNIYRNLFAPVHFIEQHIFT